MDPLTSAIVAEYQQLDTVVDQAKAKVAARKDEIAADLAAEHGPAEAARILGVAPSLITKRTKRHATTQQQRTLTVQYGIGASRTREWTRMVDYGAWHTTYQDREWVLWKESRAPGRTWWICAPVDTAPEGGFVITDHAAYVAAKADSRIPDPIYFDSEPGALKEASWLMDHPQHQSPFTRELH